MPADERLQHRSQSLFVEWSSNDYDMPEAGIDSARDSAEFAARVRESGGEVRTSEVVGAAGWGSWRAGYGDYLALFFPPH